MGKYSKVEEDIFSILGSAAYQSENLKSFPSGFEGDKGLPPYIRLTIVSGGPGVNHLSLSGVLMAEIFTAWGEGPAPSYRIADILDKYLQHRTVGTTQLFNSSADKHERDRDNPTLGRLIYSVPFSHFGVN